jgi:hypothetical protein
MLARQAAARIGCIKKWARPWFLDHTHRRLRRRVNLHLAWESRANRETRWTAFQNDPAWQKVRDDSERDGRPTAFSALK